MPERANLIVTEFHPFSEILQGSFIWHVVTKRVRMAQDSGTTWGDWNGPFRD